MSKKTISTAVNKALNIAEMRGGAALISPLDIFSSASRQYMGTNMYGQATQIAEPDIPRHLAGYEDQLKDMSFQVKTPCDLKITKVIEKFIPTARQRAAGIESPKTILYRSEETGKHGVLELLTDERNAEYFGMSYTIMPVAKRLFPGQSLPKGMVLAECNSIVDGMFTTSVEIPTVFLSTGATIEDGVEISDTYVRKMTPPVVSSKSIRWGKSSFLVNLYGDSENYKGYPDRGEKIRDDGLLFAVREYDNLMDCVGLLEENLTRPDLVSDKLTYGERNATVFDIELMTTVFDNKKRDKASMVTPSGMAEQPLIDHKRKAAYNQRILDVIESIRKEDKVNFRKALDPDLQTKAMYCLADSPLDVFNPSTKDRDSGRITRLLNAVPLEEFNIEVKYKRDFELGLGLKVAGIFGNKGVACRIRPEDEMPIDEFGNRAHAVIHGTSNVSRLIAAPLYQQHMNAASRDVSKDIRKLMDRGEFKEAWSFLMGYYEVVSEEAMFKEAEVVYYTDAKRREHLQEIYDDGIRIIGPTNDYNLGPEMVQKINAYRRPDKSKVLLTNYEGVQKPSYFKCLIGECTMVLLEKSEHKPMGESTARLQNNGLPAASTVITRDSRPVKRNALRTGEAEVRSNAATQDSATLMTEIMELATCPEVTTSAVEKLIAAEDPMNIPYLVDRRILPTGRSRSISFFNHLYACNGGKIISQNPDDIIPGT